MEALPLFDPFSPSVFSLSMNILIQNSRGALKPSFQSGIHELTRTHDLAILVVMETKLGSSKAKEITDRLPFDGAIHIDTIRLSGYCGMMTKWWLKL